MPTTESGPASHRTGARAPRSAHPAFHPIPTSHVTLGWPNPIRPEVYTLSTTLPLTRYLAVEATAPNMPTLRPPELSTFK
jgi:hypothetical protein